MTLRASAKSETFLRGQLAERDCELEVVGVRLAELERDMAEIATRAHEAEREASGLKAQLVDEGVSRSKAVAGLEADLRLLRTDLAYRVEAAEQSADTLTEMGGVLAERTGALEASRSLLEKVLDYMCVCV